MAKFIERYGVQATLYTVLLRRTNGTEFVSSGGGGPCYLTYERSEADEHIRKCKEDKLVGRVARVRVTVETLPQRKRRKV